MPDSNPQAAEAATVFKTGSSSSRMTSTHSIADKFRGVESNHRPPGSEPGIAYQQRQPRSIARSSAMFTPLPPSPFIRPDRRRARLLYQLQLLGSICPLDRNCTQKFGEKDSNLHRLRQGCASVPEPGSLPLADPRECPAGIEPGTAGRMPVVAPAWKTGASADRPRAQEAEGDHRLPAAVPGVELPRRCGARRIPSGCHRGHRRARCPLVRLVLPYQRLRWQESNLRRAVNGRLPVPTQAPPQ